MIEKISNFHLINSVLGRIKSADEDLYTQSKISDSKLFGLYLYDYTKADGNLNDLDKIMQSIRRGFYHVNITSEIKNYTKEQSDIYSLCQILEVDYNDLPVLILTNNLSYNDYYIIKTDSSQLYQQLNEIQQFCISQIDYFNFYNDLNFRKLLVNIDSRNAPQLVQIEDSLADRLSDYLSFFSLRGSSESSFLARKQIQKIVTENIFNRVRSKNSDNYAHFLLNCLSTFKDDISKVLGSDSVKLINLNKDKGLKEDQTASSNQELPPNMSMNKGLFRNILGSIGELFSGNQNQQTLRQKNSIGPNYLNDMDFENESKIIYKTFQTSYYNYKNYFNGVGPIDFSIFLLPLCKIFEIEINLSVVQWIRGELKIEMPQYYNLFKDINAQDYKIIPSSDIIQNPKQIDFNKRINGKWTAPPLGQSELIARTFYLQQKYPAEITNFNNLLLHWKTIRENRNESSHTIIKTEDDFNNVYKAFLELYSTQYFSKLNKLKLRLRSA